MFPITHIFKGCAQKASKWLPLVLVASLAAMSETGQAQTLKIRFPFNDSPGGTTTPSDTSGGAVAVTLNMLNGAGAATDFHGAAGSGVSGASRALDFHSAPSQPPQSGSVNAPVALTNASAALGFGTVTSWTASEWVKLDSLITGTLAPRLFNLGTNSSVDVGGANTIGAKFNSTTQLRFQIGGITADANFASGFAVNQWYFFAATYDGANLLIYGGTETTAAALISTTPIASATANLGPGGFLNIGNRGDTRVRGLDGWIDDFRFYTGAGDATFVENIRQSQAPIFVTGIYPNGTNIFQMTNTLGFTAGSANGIDPSGIHLTLNNADVSGALVVGGAPTSRTVTYSGLQTNKIYTGTITVTDLSGYTSSTKVSFDTFNPANYTWEGEDYDYASGQFFDNPQTNGYLGKPGITNVDYVDSNANNVNAYRGDDMSNGGAGDVVRDPYNGTGFTDYALGFFSGGSSVNYTRTYPAGLFNIYARGADGGGAASGNLSVVTNGWGTTSEQITNLGSFSFPNTGGWNTYSWAPLRDGSGNLIKVDLGAVTNTIRLTSAGDVNYNFFMLTPADTTLPSLSGIYPDGSVQFQPTNTLAFGASSAAGISSSAIKVTLSGTNLTLHFTTNLDNTHGLVLTGSSTSWVVRYPGLVTNAAYIAVITITDGNGNVASVTRTFDTYDPSFTWEAEDYDYNNGTIVPSPQTNGYATFAGVAGVDFNNITDPETFVYRPSGGGLGDQADGDTARRPYVGSGLIDYNIGWFDNGEWANYTRTLPAGTFNVFARVANGSAGSGGASLAQVTLGVGTPSQTLAPLGSMSIPPTGGWQTYTWLPFRDVGGNLVQLSGGAQKTLRLTSGGNLNANYLMLLPANTTLPTITQIYPDGTKLFQTTNKLVFTASSAAGIATSSILLSLNGNDVSSDLVFGGSSTARNVSYGKLLPNTGYTAVITVTDANGNVASTTVTFDTFAGTNFTWEGEDYDFNGGVFIDNPQTNAYYGQSGVQGVDFFESFANAPQNQYRLSDPMGTAIAGDLLRPQYIGTNDYHVGWFTTGEWLNYTRTFPAGSYYLYGRLANGNPGTVIDSLSRLTAGWGTPDQTTNDVGTFTVDSTGGWQTYRWEQLRDGSGSPAVLTLNGQTNTFKLVSGGEANLNFFMLVAPFTLNAALSGGNVVLSYQTQSGFIFQVQYKDDLGSPGTWSNLGSPVQGDGTVKSINDPASGTHRFYRLYVH